MRFSINFFTSIGLGGLTDNMREHLANMPKIIAAQQAAALAAARAEVCRYTLRRDAEVFVQVKLLCFTYLPNEQGQTVVCNA